MSTTTTTLTTPTTPSYARAGVARGAALVVGTTAVNVLAAVGAVAALDLSEDFEALQPGAIGAATAIGMLIGVALLAVLRRVRPATADRRYPIAVILGGLVSMAGPASLASNDGTVAGWSAGAVWTLAALHVIPTLAALALPRLTATTTEG